MASDFETFLLRRLGEIELELPKARARLERLEDEREDIFKAAAATGIDLDSNAGENKGYVEDKTVKKKEIPKQLTMKEAAVEILEGLPDGLTAIQIRDIMRESFGFNYKRSSLSPQLSRLKKERVVGQLGKRWLLMKYMSRLFDEEG